MVSLRWLGTKLTKENELDDISKGFSEYETANNRVINKINKVQNPNDNSERHYL